MGVATDYDGGDAPSGGIPARHTDTNLTDASRVPTHPSNNNNSNNDDTPPGLVFGDQISDDEDDDISDGFIDPEIQRELEHKWILNVSMSFRDKSDREKFFITYAEAPNRWRRVTVSCDYRHAPEDSLEADLKSLHFQRDKSARISARSGSSSISARAHRTMPSW